MDITPFLLAISGLVGLLGILVYVFNGVIRKFTKTPHKEICSFLEEHVDASVPLFMSAILAVSGVITTVLVIVRIILKHYRP